jgi:hypothetical protein
MKNGGGVDNVNRNRGVVRLSEELLIDCNEKTIGDFAWLGFKFLSRFDGKSGQYSNEEGDLCSIG